MYLILSSYITFHVPCQSARQDEARLSESMIAILQQEGSKKDSKGDPGQIHVEKYWR